LEGLEPPYRPFTPTVLAILLLIQSLKASSKCTTAFNEEFQLLSELFDRHATYLMSIFKNKNQSYERKFKSQLVLLETLLKQAIELIGLYEEGSEITFENTIAILKEERNQPSLSHNDFVMAELSAIRGSLIDIMMGFREIELGSQDSEAGDSPRSPYNKSWPASPNDKELVKGKE